MGLGGPGKGVSGARRDLRLEGTVQEGERGEENIREGESCWKSGGGRVCPYTRRRTGLADEVGSVANSGCHSNNHLHLGQYVTALQ